MIVDSLTNTQKWIVALVVSICFLVVVSPLLLTVLTKLGDNIGIRLINSQGCASWIGIGVQVLIFFLFVRLIIHILSRVGSKSTEKYGDYYADSLSDAFTPIKTDNCTLMETVMAKEYPPFNGLVDPGDMARCNGAEILAENNKSPECVDAARQCMSNPFSQECREKLNNCVRVCPNEALSQVVMDNCGFAYRS